MSGLSGHLVAITVVATMAAMSACGAEPRDALTVAQARVSENEKALEGAQAAASESAAAFCATSTAYVVALDRYGDVLVETSPTVGDVRSAGDDLMKPRAETVAAGETLVSAQQALAEAERDLAEAEAALLAAQAAGAEVTTASATASEPTKDFGADQISIARVRQAESDFATAREGITDQTPLRAASEQFNAAAVALELAWLRLLADSGCLEGDQEKQASAAVKDYTETLQQDLADTGHYRGKVDGIYGPDTVAAVQSLQKGAELPQTGALDKATAAALRAEIASAGGTAAHQETATTAAVQQTLKLAGHWNGAVDGQWTDELTGALKDFQTELGVPATGKVDAATIAALESAIENGQRPTTGPSSATARPTSTPPTATPAPTKS